VHERAYDRFSPKSTIQIIDRLDGTVLGILINISKGGFMMLSEGICPEAGEIHQIQIIN